jgi:hypothetical protein
MLNIDLADVELDQIDPDYTTNYANEEEQIEILDDYVYVTGNNENNKKKKKENMMNYVELYQDNKDILLKNETLQNDFRKNHCVDGELTHKDMSVKYEMAEHVFPEIKFRRASCNPCLKACEFSIIEQKLQTEDNLVRK